MWVLRLRVTGPRSAGEFHSDWGFVSGSPATSLIHLTAAFDTSLLAAK